MTVSAPEPQRQAGSAVLLEEPGWKRDRWWGVILLVFGVQLGLIFWLSDRTPIHARKTLPLPTLQVAGPDWAEWLALVDPTVFALPHRQSFSGPAWLRSGPADLRDLEWTAEPRWPPTMLLEPGVAFSELAEPRSVGSTGIMRQSWPDLGIGLAAGPEAFADASVCRLEGDLASRRLLTPFQLPSFPSPVADLLTNTIVQAAVNGQGMAESLTLLGSSGSADADRLALELALNARFEPLVGSTATSETPPSASLSWGQLVFCWHTVAPTTVTNSTSGGSAP